MKLFLNALAKAGMGLLCFGLLLFLPAGTFRYQNAWFLMAILFIPMIFVGIVLYYKAPELLKKRLHTHEENAVQKSVILLSSLLFAAVFVLSGIDFRLQWSHLPPWIIIAASIVFLVGYGLYVEVMRENAYLSRTVEVQKNQKVIDTGLYGVVRHPMYFSTILLFLSMPVVLGSLYAFLLMLCCYPAIIAWRIRDEEKILTEGLMGYKEYTLKVKYRMIPFIW